MGDKMDRIHLQQTLRRLCLNTEWNYAAFWKLQHRAPMMLILEDAFYDSQESFDSSDHMHFHVSLKNMHEGHYLQDPLGFAVEKMSYLVYYLGEGIIGQVAVTGKHQWVFADKPGSHPWSSSEFYDGWQHQFSVGINTVAVVAVVPYGVVQLGSLNTVLEDTKLVAHIKDVFNSLQNSSVEFIPNQLQYSVQSTLYPSKIPAKCSGLEIFDDFPHSSDKATSNEKEGICSLEICNNLFHGILPLPGLHQKKAVEVVNKDLGISATSRDDESAEVALLRPKSEILNMKQQKQVQMNLLDKNKYGEKNIGWMGMAFGSKHSVATAPYNLPTENMDNFTLPAYKSGIGYHFGPLGALDSAVWDRVKFDSVVYVQNEELQSPKPLAMQLEKDLELQSSKPLAMYLGNDLEQKSETEVSCIDTANACLKFSTVCELHEAIGPTFKKEKEICDWSESEGIESEVHNESPERMVKSQLTECGAEYLLGAVVASAYNGSSNVKSENSLYKPAESLLTTGKTAQTVNRVKIGSGLACGSVGQSSLLVENDTLYPLNSIWDSAEISIVRSPKELPSKTLSTCSKQMEINVEPAKIKRKRARPGESCRPRPRDRQLIQDRVKELRELVPNGSKCSIDSLLERTIKHMLFLQIVTKDAEKMKKYTESKFCDQKMGFLESCSREHGSSWAVEVGNQTNLCPIAVRNLNMNGQMLVEMLCDECSRFLEIAEAIRSLGLMILKGVTETLGDKTWACFVIEGQNNRGLHRVDILRSLLQLLQPRSAI